MKDLQNGTDVIDCSEFYVPRRYDEARQFGLQILKRSKQGKIITTDPKYYHRRSLDPYISKEQDSKGQFAAWSTGQEGKGFVMGPRMASPQRGDKTILANAFRVLLDRLPDDIGLVGKINDHPIRSFQGITPPEACLFNERHICNECNGQKGCMFLPRQVLDWGYQVDGEFMPLASGVAAVALDQWELRDLVKERMSVSKWEEFINKPSSEFSKPQYEGMSKDDIGAEKIIKNLMTLQRVDLKTAHCHGIAVAQFDYAIEIRYLDDDVVAFVNLVAGSRVPWLEGRRHIQSKMRQKKDVDVVEEVEVTTE